MKWIRSELGKLGLMACYWQNHLIAYLEMSLDQQRLLLRRLSKDSVALTLLICVFQLLLYFTEQQLVHRHCRVTHLKMLGLLSPHHLILVQPTYSAALTFV